MLEAGIIEPSDSPWASGVVMVPKKTGGWRLCADYRPLNKVTIKDSYPLPRIDESLDLISGSVWFSSLDLRSGYYQVPLAPESRPKTAFCTGRGLWQFKVMCFGLCNAPATFARLMDKVLADVPREQCLVYLDDILAHGGSFESALEALRRVLERIRAAGLKLHPDKCHFMKREVSFLGHRVTGEGISTMADKVGMVRNWPTPANRRQLKSFIGLASYYRRFVQGFATIAAPLHRLLEKDRSYGWTEECQAAFQHLQRALCEAPVLAPPSPSLAFVLDTDASSEEVGGVLSQVWPEGERVVAYFSKAFEKPERNYCVTRRELLAVLRSVRHFKYYLCGLPFVVRTDHAALQWLMSFREPKGQIARWLEELQAYDFEIEHRPGTRHTNADALSCRPCAEVGCNFCDRAEGREQGLQEEREEFRAVGQVREVFCGELQTIGPDEWWREQEQDSDLQPVLQWVEAQERPPWEDVGALSRSTKGLWAKFGELRLRQGLLQRAWVAPGGGKTWQLVVPWSRQGAVLEAMHGALGSGHFGATKTLRRLRQGFYWGNYQRDVADFCRRCDECTARKGPTGRSQAPLQQLRAGAPLERVAVDIVGPLPITDRGNRYILTAMDYFSKWPEAYPIADVEAETVADALVEGMFCRFGVPESLHSDQGRNFESRVFAAMCERLGIHKTRTTPLHPQSDGLVERFNRTLGEQLALHVSEHQRDWDRHLPLVLMACRSAVQESTGCSPALLMLGNELRTPVVVAFGQPPDAPGVPPGPEYARRLQDRLETTHQFAREQMQAAERRQKRNHDIRSRGRDFVPGELVWVYEPRRKKGRIPKLDSHWRGPCEVLAKVGEVVYRVRLPAPRRRKVVLHRDRRVQGRTVINPCKFGSDRTRIGKVVTVCFFRIFYHNQEALFSKCTVSATQSSSATNHHQL
ncbi:Transposon Ty3-I Gag-Pol poly [Solea senegalensis]|uniref:Gypsy retrotransposon integrase-like protein 1 n=1 Tax=Solea senegalensis TaxID=28829 RepID=A0AAV6PJS6_SOLSE|nr:Transposon Ty3-I Gag-Pol poly [Solea senegalensis]